MIFDLEILFSVFWFRFSVLSFQFTCFPVLSSPLIRELTTQSRCWARGYGYLQDQLKRAISSVVLNCAEGNARTGQAERKRFFQISRASLAEVGACLDLAHAFQLINHQKKEAWKGQCHLISKLLYRLH